MSDAAWIAAARELAGLGGCEYYMPQCAGFTGEVMFGLVAGRVWEDHRQALGPDPLHSQVCEAKAEYRVLVKTVLDRHGLDGINYGRCPNCGAT